MTKPTPGIRFEVRREYHIDEAAIVLFLRYREPPNRRIPSRAMPIREVWLQLDRDLWGCSRDFVESLADRVREDVAEAIRTRSLTPEALHESYEVFCNDPDASGRYKIGRFVFLWSADNWDNARFLSFAYDAQGRRNVAYDARMGG